MIKNTEEIKDNALKEILKIIKGVGAEVNKNIPAIVVDNYSKKFRKFIAAKDVSFEVGHGVIHGFIGPNGSGKTTTIKAIMGAYVPSNGSIKINGNAAGHSSANRLIGYIPERASFPKHLNTIQYLKAMGELSGLTAKDAHGRAEKILVALGLEAHKKRKPISFSSGMQKKILLAQSLLTNPKILILDEPAANLDPTARKELFDQLLLLRNQGKTILISSHILSELERIIDEVTFIYYGEVIYSGGVEAFNNDETDVFIKSEDNVKLKKFLVENKFNVVGDVKSELLIEHIKPETNEKIFKLLTKSGIKILSYRSNDLQSVYDKLISKSEKERRGKQEVDGNKAIAMINHTTIEDNSKTIDKPKKKRN